MTHARLFIRPLGPRRPNATCASTATLQYHDGGCGCCNGCRTSLSDAHPDVTSLRTEQLNIGIDGMCQLVSGTDAAPVNRHW